MIWNIYYLNKTQRVSRIVENVCKNALKTLTALAVFKESILSFLTYFHPFLLFDSSIRSNLPVTFDCCYRPIWPLPGQRHLQLHTRAVLSCPTTALTCPVLLRAPVITVVVLVCVLCWPDVDLEQLLRVELKEFSDGETTVALTSVTTDVEVWSLPYKRSKMLHRLWRHNHVNLESFHNSKLY